MDSNHQHDISSTPMKFSKKPKVNYLHYNMLQHLTSCISPNANVHTTPSPKRRPVPPSNNAT